MENSLPDAERFEFPGAFLYVLYERGLENSQVVHEYQNPRHTETILKNLYSISVGFKRMCKMGVVVRDILRSLFF